jgi:hypothetical protein
MDARFDRHSRFDSRVPVQALSVLRFHFSSLKTVQAALLAGDDSSLKREKA